MFVRLFSGSVTFVTVHDEICIFDASLMMCLCFFIRSVVFVYFPLFFTGNSKLFCSGGTLRGHPKIE